MMFIHVCTIEFSQYVRHDDIFMDCHIYQFVRELMFYLFLCVIDASR